MKLLAAFAVGLLVVGLLLIGYAHAEMQALYVNADNRSWTLVSTHISEDECDKAARRVMREGKVHGAGCARFDPTPEDKSWRPPQPDGYVSKDQQRINDRNQIYENRRERFERQFSAPTPR
jgi:hypothetical protein